MQKFKNFIQMAKSALLLRKEKGYQTKADYHQKIKERLFRLTLAALVLGALVGGISAVAQKIITVSNSVNGRELPIYCVETTKKQVALSFDAA